MAVHDLIRLLLYRPMERLPFGVLRNGLMGLAFGLMLIGGYAMYEPVSRNSLAVLIIVGLTISMFLWGSYRLWSFTIAPIIGTEKKFIAPITRLPYWFIAGGISYTLGLLCMKKWNLMNVQDIPVKNLFLFGGKFSAAVMIVLECAGVFFLYHENVSDKSRTT